LKGRRTIYLSNKEERKRKEDSFKLKRLTKGKRENISHVSHTIQGPRGLDR